MYFIMSIIFYVSSPVAPHRLFATINLAMVILPFFIVSAPCAITYFWKLCGVVAGKFRKKIEEDMECFYEQKESFLTFFFFIVFDEYFKR